MVFNGGDIFVYHVLMDLEKTVLSEKFIQIQCVVNMDVILINT